MTNQDFKEICNTIGYSFKNPYLLEQAFIRKSFSQEHPGIENNEVLEFFGDKVLDYVIVWSMSTPEWYGSLTNKGQFHSKFDEGKLTVIKKNLVDKQMLSKRIEILDLSKYLILGQGDIKNKVQEDPSVLEDLFEAILGAAAIDCNWNMAVLRKLVFKMLDPVSYLNQGYDKDFNYSGQLQEWCQKKNIPLEYNYQIVSDPLACEFLAINGGMFAEPLMKRYRCIVKLLGYTFYEEGRSKSQARMNVSKLILDYIHEKGLDKKLKDEESKEEKNDNAIQDLNMLFQKGLIKQPLYEYQENYDEGGKPYWSVRLSLPDYEPYFYGDFSSKKEGKRKLAAAMLKKLAETNSKENRSSNR